MYRVSLHFGVAGTLYGVGDCECGVWWRYLVCAMVNADAEHVAVLEGGREHRRLLAEWASAQ
jgi:hypothetical protein